MNNSIIEEFHKIPYFDDYDTDELNDLVALSKVLYFKLGDIVMDCGVGTIQNLTDYLCKNFINNIFRIIEVYPHIIGGQDCLITVHNDFKRS